MDVAGGVVMPDSLSVSSPAFHAAHPIVTPPLLDKPAVAPGVKHGIEIDERYVWDQENRWPVGPTGW